MTLAVALASLLLAVPPFVFWCAVRLAANYDNDFGE
jgi:hypothetical protein